MIKVQVFYEAPTSTLSYLVYDEISKDAVIIDPILNFNADKDLVSEESYQEMKSFIDAKSLKPSLSFETHIHADHISSFQRLKRDYPSIKSCINDNVTIVQETFAKKLDLDFKADGSQFDILFLSLIHI